MIGENRRLRFEQPRGQRRRRVAIAVQSISGTGRGRLALQDVRHRGDRRRQKDRLDRDRAIQGRGEPCDELDGLERVAAEVEEVIVNPDPLELEHIGPDAGERVLERVEGATYSADGSSGPGPGSGSALRSTLPLGERGKSSRVTNAEGTMYSGSAAWSHRRSSATSGPADARGTT